MADTPRKKVEIVASNVRKGMYMIGVDGDFLRGLGPDPHSGSYQLYFTRAEAEAMKAKIEAQASGENTK